MKAISLGHVKKSQPLQAAQGSGAASKDGLADTPAQGQHCGAVHGCAEARRRQVSRRRGAQRADSSRHAAQRRDALLAGCGTAPGPCRAAGQRSWPEERDKRAGPWCQRYSAPHRHGVQNYRQTQLAQW